jgi:cytidine deaminase
VAVPDPNFSRFYDHLLYDLDGDAARSLARAIAARAATAQNVMASENDTAAGFSAIVESVLDSARSVRQYAYAPYSGFRVGAAVLDAAGRITAGTNVENASYGLTLCAERAALAAARAGGAERILLVAIAADTAEPITPCGACRQWIAELAPHALIAMLTLEGSERWCTPNDLLPLAFDGSMFRTTT